MTIFNYYIYLSVSNSDTNCLAECKHFTYYQDCTEHLFVKHKQHHLLTKDFNYTLTQGKKDKRLSEFPEGKSSYIELFTSNHKKLCLYALKFIRNSHVAEDIVQEVFISIWNNRKNFDFNDKQQIEKYLYRSVKVNCIKYLQRDKNHNEHYRRLMIELSGTTDYTDHLLSNELSERINAILRELPEKSRHIFKLSRNLGFQNKEIAAKLELSEKSIEYHITKTLKVFKEKLFAFLYGLMFLIINLIR